MPYDIDKDQEKAKQTYQSSDKQKEVAKSVKDAFEKSPKWDKLINWLRGK
jgi:hypothetical protein